jgi:hypothetical protein
MNIFLFSGFIFLGNLSFGWWRYRVRKFSLAWIFSIHIPVLIIIASRLALHMPYKLATIPLTVTAFLLGQYGGGFARGKISPTNKSIPDKH